MGISLAGGGNVSVGGGGGYFFPFSYR